ncbi:hypothetical protein EV183_003445 [Coemansia sp. RSA 2336]|nr:hypothetical protein EV183_003445 [Coemansia sp. RSA 2336]
MHLSACALPADAAIVAEIERRILEPRHSAQAPALRTARRRFLELQELLSACQSHAGSAVCQDLLIGQARAFKLTPEAAVLDASVGRLPVSGAGGGGSPVLNGFDMAIETKQAAVTRCLELAPASASTSGRSIASAQSRLLSMHAQCIGELISEAELLAALCRHGSDHPIYAVARGLEMYFGGLIESLSLKLQIYVVEMHNVLYSPEVLQAAERLRELLSAREAQLAKEQTELNERLSIYRDAGSEFQEIAAAYAAVLRDTEQIRKDIARMSQL